MAAACSCFLYSKIPTNSLDSSAVLVALRTARRVAWATGKVDLYRGTWWSSRCVIPLLCQENVAMSAHYGACVNGTSADQLRAQRRTRTAHLQRGPCCSCGRRPRRPTHSVRASGHPWSMTLFVRCVLYHPTCVSTFTLTYGFLHPSISAKIPCRICGRRSMPILNGSDWPCGHLRAFERTTAAITALLCTNHLLQARPAHLYK